MAEMSATVTVTPLIHITTYDAVPVRIDPAPPPPPPPNPRIAIDYFAEIALGSEYGQSEALVHKWTRSPAIAIHGNPDQADIATLNAVVSELNQIIRPIDLVFAEGDGDIDVHFAPEAEFTILAGEYVPGNSGFAHMWWDANRNIIRGRVLISTTIGDRRLRDHVIREEITQVLGLANDSVTHADSIFYQDFSATPQFSELDRRVIEFLYHPAIVPGMTRQQALPVLDTAG